MLILAALFCLCGNYFLCLDSRTNKQEAGRKKISLLHSEILSNLEDTSLRIFSPKKKVIQGQTMPRTSGLLYRGLTAPEYSLQEAIQAMLGNNNQVIKSKLAQLIISKCKKHDITLRISNVDKVKTFLNTVKCPANLNDLKSKALLITQNQFIAETQHANFKEIHLNYNSPIFDNLPSNLIFASAYVETASWYSHRVVVFRDLAAKPQALDLSYYNFANNNMWLEPGLEKMQDLRDHAEVIMPVAIFGEQIRGYEIRAKKKPTRSFLRKLRWAFYRLKIGGIPAVLVLDGQIETDKYADAIIKDKNIFYYAESQAALTDVFPYPKKLTKKAKLQGFIIKREHLNELNQVKSKLRNLPKSENVLPKKLLTKLATMGNVQYVKHSVN